ncbi:MAG: phytoene/squalene synthase family protein [Pseudomonadota bacterium]
MMRGADLAHCRETIKHGSKSFYAASKLLPARVRDPALVLYAFCRLADDAVDLVDTKLAAVEDLRERLERAYAGKPKDDPVERAFAELIAEVDLPRALPEALLEGFHWDAMEFRYRTLSDVRAYSARVASAVGAMMSVLMKMREYDALARACDLGVAMQLTNIARDIGEDAEAGRLYLPINWFDEAGLDVDGFIADPSPRPEVTRMAQRLLAEANRLYYRSEAGISRLPRRCRPGIYAARYIYAGIGRHIRAAGFDSVTRRARTGLTEKIGLAVASFGAAAADAVMPRSPVLYAPPLAETAFLVDAAADPAAEPASWSASTTQTLVSTLTRLREHDLATAGVDEATHSGRPA